MAQKAATDEDIERWLTLVSELCTKALDTVVRDR